MAQVVVRLLGVQDALRQAMANISGGPGSRMAGGPLLRHTSVITFSAGL